MAEDGPVSGRRSSWCQNLLAESGQYHLDKHLYEERTYTHTFFKQ